MLSKCCSAEIIKKAVEVNSRGCTLKYICSNCKKKCEAKPDKAAISASKEQHQKALNTNQIIHK